MYVYVFPKKVTLLITAKRKEQCDLQHHCVTPQLSLLLFRFVAFHYMTKWNLMWHSFSLKVLVHSMKKEAKKKKWLQCYRAKRIKQQLYGKYFKRFASKNDWSKWPARWEFDRSSPRSGWTLFVDQPLLWALALAEPGGPWHLTFVLGWLEILCLFDTNHMLGTLDFTSSEPRLPSIFLRVQPWITEFHCSLKSIVGNSKNALFCKVPNEIGFEMWINFNTIMTLRIGEGCTSRSLKLNLIEF